MAFQLRALLLSYSLVLAQAQTMMLSACSRVGDEEYCIDQDGSSVLWTSYASSTAASSTPATTVASTTAAPATTSSSSSVTAITGCHMHETIQFCMAGTAEYQVMTTATATEELPAQYTGCHAHGSEMFCFDPSGDEVEVVAEGAATEESGSTESSDTGGQNCHFHAGVEHCVGAGESESGSSTNCQRRDREYNVPLRIGLLFALLATSALAVFAPILMGSYIQNKIVNTCLLMLKQFGTGVMVSTAFIHLLTHANLMLTNECINYVVEYEGTAAAIMMAGIFLAFLIEYTGSRILARKHAQHSPSPSNNSLDPTNTHLETGDGGDSKPHHLTTLAGCGPHHTPPGQEKLAVAVMETGIIFHSLLIGLTLVVAGDTFFLTLFAVIVFHQSFEGLALGSRIAELPPTTTSIAHKISAAAAFALITPIGMAIGIGVLRDFNGNDAATLIAIGTLDAVSAGVLAWVSLVEMWAGDWGQGGRMEGEGWGVRVGGLGAVVLGMAGMSLLGKWA